MARFAAHQLLIRTSIVLEVPSFVSIWPGTPLRALRGPWNAKNLNAKNPWHIRAHNFRCGNRMGLVDSSKEPHWNFLLKIDNNNFRLDIFSLLEPFPNCIILDEPVCYGDVKNSFHAIYEQKEAELSINLQHQRSVCDVYSKSYTHICLRVGS